jgi:hypothetical protein
VVTFLVVRAATGITLVLISSLSSTMDDHAAQLSAAPFCFGFSFHQDANFLPFPDHARKHRISKDMQQLSLLTDDARMELKWLLDPVIPIGGSD